jgi:hypothetical protein
MQHPLQAAGAPGDSGVATPVPGSPDLADQPTVHEFLTQLVSSADARSAFDADPRAALNHAGLGDLTPTDVLHATSLALDYAPIEVVEAYNLSLHSSVAKFAASTQQVATDTLHPAHSHEQEATEHSMLHSSSSAPAADQFSKSHDVDKNMNVQIHEQDSHNGIDIHHINVASGNTVNVASMAANASSAVSSVTESVNHAVNVGNGLVHDLGGGLPTGTEVINQVEATVGSVVPAPASMPIVGVAVGSVASMAEGATHGDPTSALSNVPVVGAVAGAVTGALPIAGHGDVTSALSNVPVAGAVAGTVTGAVTGSLPGASGGETNSALPDVSNVPVVGEVAGTVTGALPNVPVVGDVAATVTGAVPHLPAVGDVAGGLNVSNAPAVGAVTQHVSAVTEHVTSTVHSLPVVSEVANSVPMPDVHSVPVVGDVASGLVSEAHALPVVGDVTHALPLDHGL